jgi:hypothetical protein
MPLSIKIWFNIFFPGEIDGVTLPGSGAETVMPPPFNLPAQKGLPHVLTDGRVFSNSDPATLQSQMSFWLDVVLEDGGGQTAPKATVTPQAVSCTTKLVQYDKATATVTPSTPLTRCSDTKVTVPKMIPPASTGLNKWRMSLYVRATRANLILAPAYRLDGIFDIDFDLAGNVHIGFSGRRRRFPAHESYYAVNGGAPVVIFARDPEFDGSYWSELTAPPRFFIGPSDALNVDSAMLAPMVAQNYSVVAEVDGFFNALPGSPRGGFLAWFNAKVAGVDPYAAAWPANMQVGHGQPRDLSTASKYFAMIVDQFNVMAGRGDGVKLRLLEIIALFTIVRQECGATLAPITELAPRPKRKKGVKAPAEAARFFPYFFQYNHGGAGSFNIRAAVLLADPKFLAAHQKADDPEILAWKGDPAWGKAGALNYPSRAPVHITDRNAGFAKQFDFVKFRGRGFIQTTFRDAYGQLLTKLLADGAVWDDARTPIKARWGAMDPADILSASCTDEWDRMFEAAGAGQERVLALAIATHNQAKGGYLNLALDSETLFSLDVGSPPDHSLAAMANAINGKKQIDYAVNFVSRVEAICRAVADAARGR